MEDDSFVYSRRKTLGSFLWSLWLRFPQSFRCRVYSFLLAFSRPSSNAPDLRRLPLGFLYAKLGGAGVYQEALVLQFVAEYTSIPAPRVLDLIEDYPSRSSNLVITSHVPGTPIHSHLDSLTPEQVTTVADTLRNWLYQLQAIRSPYGRALCGYMGNAFWSYRINTKDFSGPYRSQNRFHEDPCCAMTDDHDAKVRSLAAIIRQKTYDISFIHGNVSPENVLVDKRCVPVGLVGWECAAFMLSYWELNTGAWAVRATPRENIWTHILIRCLPQFTDELKVDRELWKTYTPY